jgi:hypothetical protein
MFGFVYSRRHRPGGPGEAQAAPTRPA